MCESSVYLLENERETLVMEDVGWLETEGERILVKDAAGVEKTIRARLRYADLVAHRIVLEPLPTAPAARGS